MRIAVASGKGGTGKTTVAVNLALAIEDAMLIDCDVEGPNCHIFFPGKMEHVGEVSIPAPEFDSDGCVLCGKCADFCQYNAISVIGDKLLFFEEMCHGCGGCWLLCPAFAIEETKHRVGVIEKGGAGKLDMYHGILDIGEPFGVPIIRELKALASPGKTVVFDAPPGTACPAVETMRDSDFCVLVTEPTPFGLHDLKLTLDVVAELDVPFGVVINRDGIGDNRVDEHCRKEGIEILCKIPNDIRVARLYSAGTPMSDELPEYAGVFSGLYDKIMEALR